MSYPHKCPICAGRQSVPNDFYDLTPDYLRSTPTSTTGVKCRSCNGMGFLWSEDPDPGHVDSDVTANWKARNIALAENRLLSMDSLRRSLGPDENVYGAAVVASVSNSDEAPGMLVFTDDDDDQTIHMDQFNREHTYGGRSPSAYTSITSRTSGRISG